MGDDQRPMTLGRAANTLARLKQLLQSTHVAQLVAPGIQADQCSQYVEALEIAIQQLE